MPDKRLHGRFLTTGNPFSHRAFGAWWDNLPGYDNLLEPFAGANGIPALLRDTGKEGAFTSYDITPLHADVQQRDTLADFPTGFTAVVTNPPYLSRHFARRKGLHVDDLPWGAYNNLYKVSIAECLKHAPFVAAIIPESFVTSRLFQARLTDVISLTTRMFDDTEMPTCLALWTDSESADFTVWRGDQRLGQYSDLARALPGSPHADRITFNVPAGQIGLHAIDGTTGPSIRFTPADHIDDDKVKHSARLVTRIQVTELADSDIAALIEGANRRLAQYRASTQDVLLTAFKGLRTDGAFRRRIDYKTARAVLALALEDLSAPPAPDRSTT